MGLRRKFLVIRFSSIGDIVLATPVFRHLKTQMEDVEVHFLTKAKHVDIVKANPYIDRVWSFQQNLREVIPQLKAEKFDVIIDLHRNTRSLMVKSALGTSSYSFRKLNFRKWLLVALKVNKLPNIHIVERYLEPLYHLGVKNDLQGLDYFIPEEDKFDLTQLPEDFSQGYIVLVLSGTYFTKRLPAEKYLSLIRESNLRFILLGGDSEKPVAEAIMAQAHNNVLNFCGMLNINQSASLVEQARLVISNDTGLMHIAAAFRKCILSVWGNTVPQLGMHPYLPGEGSKILEVEGLSCRPCSKLGKQQCPKNHFRCMNDISEKEMLKWARKYF